VQELATRFEAWRNRINSQSYSRELADDAGPVLTSASAKDPCVGDAILGEYSLFALRTFTANLSNLALKEFSDAPE
jgi:hypothetical protein